MHKFSNSSASLDGRIAIVSGALGDIGLATVSALLERGACVAMGDLMPEPEAQTRLEALFPGTQDALSYTCVDVSDESQVESWLTSVAAQWGAPSVAISNAAIVKERNALEVDATSWRRQMEVNLNGAFWVARNAARLMLASQTAGRIVFVGSWAAHAPHPQITAYSVAKAGLRMACQCLALELAPHGILVNEIAPGFVDAGLSAQLFAADETLKTRSQERVPTGEILLAEEVAREVLAVCDFSRRHLTGSCVVVDGGLSLLVGNPKTP
ncbi:MAG TPA: SDR family oxidoreductase [Abditibacteriaceae bacterium]|jgi:glucose 1-dehydrogenase